MAYELEQEVRRRAQAGRSSYTRPQTPGRGSRSSRPGRKRGRRRDSRPYPFVDVVNAQPLTPWPVTESPVQGSEHIRWVQTALNQVMDLRLPVNGIMGPETRSAVRSFQTRQGLVVDGIVGPDTERALMAARSSGTPPASDDQPPSDELAYFDLETEGEAEEGEVNRSSKDYVRWIQGALNRILGLHLAVDGISGSQTRSAVRSFQQQRGLTADGIVGPITEAALIAAGAGNPPGSTPSPYVPPAPAPPAGTSALRTKIAQIAMQEWQRWGQGARKESESAMRPILEDYWRTGVGFLPSETNWWSNVAWSAAFISWVVRKAGAGNTFRYSSAHTDYVSEAKRNRLANNSNPFKAYRIAEVAPRVGDLVCLERSGSGVTYDNVDQGFRSSHCDIVVDVKPGFIKTIGGNLSDSVNFNQKTITTDSNGRINVSGYYAVVSVGG